MNGIYAAILPRIRSTNPTRTIFVGPGQWNGIGELSSLRLPADDSNLVVTVHNYSPFYYTHQGASWTGPSTATTNIVYPGPPPSPVSQHPSAAGDAGLVAWLDQYNTLPLAQNPCSSNSFDASYAWCAAWAAYYGRPIHVGEFGAYSTSDDASRERFYREMRESLDRHGLGWASWDWKAGFYYWNRTTGQPGPGLRRAFFPNPEVTIDAQGRVRSVLSPGKRVRLDRAPSLTGPWLAVMTQTLMSAEFATVPERTSSMGVFRVVWEK